MKLNITIVLLIITASSAASMNGGVSIDHIDAHSNVSSVTPDKQIEVNNFPQAPIDKPKVYKVEIIKIIGINALRHTNNIQS